MTSSANAKAEPGQVVTPGGNAPRVMLVDDSGVSRALMTRWLNEAGVDIVATARNGEEARDLIADIRPDIVLLDIEMPRLGGIDVLPDLLKRCPGVKIIMVSTLSRRNARITIDALRAGATDALAKPDSGWAGTSAPAFREELVRKVLALGAEQTEPTVEKIVKPRANRIADSAARRAVPVHAAGGDTSIVVIGSSTGGPNALFTMLNQLPQSPSAPILIAQHMPPMFTSILAEHITRLTGISAAEAVHGEPLTAGRIYVAPGGLHMSVTGGPGRRSLISLSDAEPENFCRPSVNPLFRSAASGWGSSALGIVLTGMGSDGLDGARALKAAGAQVLVQDAATSVVWGMPGAIVRAELADAVLPLEQLGARLADQLACS